MEIINLNANHSHRYYLKTVAIKDCREARQCRRNYRYSPHPCGLQIHSLSW